MNSTATTGAIGTLAGQKMRLGNQLGAEQTAGDWAKNVGYQLNLAPAASRIGEGAGRSLQHRDQRTERG